MQQGKGITVEESVTIDRPVGEVYAFWRNFANLPRFMNHLESVSVTGEGRSHWVAKAPLGQRAEWDAEIINELENKVIAWRSLGDTPVPSAGYVHFEEAPGGRGTVVKVALEYSAPAGAVGATVAKLFHEEPSLQVEEDLNRFKQVMEAGETPSTEGQPSGRGPSHAKVADRGDMASPRATAPNVDAAASGTVDDIGASADDTVTEASEESFPASDAPSWAGTRESGV